MKKFKPSKMEYFLKAITLIVFTLFTKNSYSQDTIRQYFDSDWKKTKSKEYSYHRIAYQISKNEWLVNDYYKNDTIQMKGIYNSKKLKTKEGKFSYYYENGSKKSEGSYYNNIINGKWNWFYKNNSLKSIGTYKKGEKIGEWKGFYPNKSIRYTGNYSKNNLEGNWIWYFENGKISSKETYLNNVIEKYQFYDINGNKVDNPEFLTKSMFPGGFQEFNKYVKENFQLPKNLSSLRDKLIVNFKINLNGDAENIKLKNKTNTDVDQHIIDLIDKMPLWIVGKNHNIPYEFTYELPLKLRVKK